MNPGKTEKKIAGLLSKEGVLHFTLMIIPDDSNGKNNGALAEAAKAAGTSAFLVRPAFGTSSLVIESTVKSLKKHGLPVILVPTNVDDICPSIDAVLFTTLLNSRNVYWMVGAQALGAPVLKQMNIEAIPTGYAVVEPGGTMSWMGDVKPLPKSDPRLAALHALGAEYFGMRYLYLETGLRRKEQVPTEIISAIAGMSKINIVLECINGPVDYVKAAIGAGAKIIVTGPEDDIKAIISAIATAHA